MVDLGITLIHLMPVLKPRVGENDGGYAVQNYRDIDPKIGNIDDFLEMVDYFNQKGIRICIDYVINHTSDDHEWAVKAKSGEKNIKTNILCMMMKLFLVSLKILYRRFSLKLHLEILPSIKI